MKKEKLNVVTIVTNIVCTILLITMFAVLFLPTWQYEDGMLSLASYIGFPSEKQMLLKGFKDTLNLKAFPSVNDVVTTPVVGILFMLVSVVATLLSKKLPLGAVAALIGGLVGLIGYATNPFFSLAETQMILIITSAVTAVAGLVGVILFTLDLVKKIKANAANM